MTNRGTGTTTRQMQDAPKGAYFVWCNGQLEYPKALAKKIGREDLKIIRPYDLERDRMCGIEFTGIVVDHAAVLTDEQRECLRRLAPYIRQREATS